jgi:ketosteroid isomerase-like protein
VSQQNIEIGRRALVAMSEGDYDTWFELTSPAIRFELGPGVNPTGMQSVYTGHEGLREFRNLLSDVFDRHESTIEEISDAGDRVLCAFRERAVGRMSGVVVDRMLYSAGTVEDGRITRVCTYLDASAALAALEAQQ